MMTVCGYILSLLSASAADRCTRKFQWVIGAGGWEISVATSIGWIWRLMRWAGEIEEFGGGCGGPEGFPDEMVGRRVLLQLMHRSFS